MPLINRRDVLTSATTLLAASRLKSARAAPGDLEAVLRRWDGDEHPDLRGVTVRLRGKIVAERYYNDGNADELHDIRSAGKSITSLLVGIAIDQGHIKAVSDIVSRYLPELKNAAIGDVPLADVLTMRSGLAADDDVATSPGNEDKLLSASNPIDFLRHVPRASSPGSVYVYNSLTAYVAGLVVARAAACSEAELARSTLFEPLGIGDFAWATDALGNTRGQGNLSLTNRDLSTIGQMVLNRGAWRDRKIVSESWISASLKPLVDVHGVDPYADSYGYFWFTKTHLIGNTPLIVHFASGNGGNKIYVVPEREMVVAITSSAYDHGYGQRRSQAILLSLLSDVT